MYTNVNTEIEIVNTANYMVG